MPIRFLTPLRLLFAALLFGAMSGAATAHPHIWIKATATVVFENGKVVGLRHEWTFDDFFSSALIADFDKNKDKTFDEAEIKALHDQAFIALKDFGYFTHARANGQAVKIAGTRDFAPAIVKDRVVYRFTALLPEPVDPSAVTFDAAVYDETYYVDVDVHPQVGVKLAGAGSERCTAEMIQDKNAPLYFGAAFVSRIHLTCGKP